MLKPLALGAVGALISSIAVAHPHTAGPTDQVIANGQNHPAFRYIGDGLVESCVEYGLLDGFGEAWYGLETAHHGPDQGTAGKGDGCFVTEGVHTTGLSGRPTDDENPGID